MDKYPTNWIISGPSESIYRVYGTAGQVKAFMFKKLHEYEQETEADQAETPHPPCFIDHKSLAGVGGWYLTLRQEYAYDDELDYVCFTARGETGLPYYDLNAQEHGWTNRGKNIWYHENSDGTYDFLRISESLPWDDQTNRWKVILLKGIDPSFPSEEERKKAVIKWYGGDYEIPDQDIAGNIARDKYILREGSVIHRDYSEILAREFVQKYMEKGEADGTDGE